MMLKQFYEAEMDVRDVNENYVLGKMVYVNPESVSSIMEYRKNVTSINLENGQTILVMGNITKVAEFLQETNTKTDDSLYKEAYFDNVKKFIDHISAK